MYGGCTLDDTAPVADVAADEIAAELLGGVHDDEAAGGRIDYQLAWPGNGADQPADQANWL